MFLRVVFGMLRSYRQRGHFINIPQNNCNRRFFTAKRLISIPGMTYQNFTPMEEWEIYFSEVQRKVSVAVFSGVILHLL